MWFKQAQVWRIQPSFSIDTNKLTQLLQPLAFSACLPSFAMSVGWVAPLGEDPEQLVYTVNGFQMICLQWEEKIIPSIVVRQKLLERIKSLETQRGKKISSKEKQSLKEDIIAVMLPVAFTKLTRVFAYIDPLKQHLVIASVSKKRIETFFELFKKSFPEVHFQAIVAERLSPLLTHWLLHEDYPDEMTIGKSCLLKDPKQPGRVIRCQQQDLSANAIRLIVQDNCEAQQLALSWRGYLEFVFCEDSSLRSIKFQTALLESSKELSIETPEQQFDADFVLMTETFRLLFEHLFQGASHELLEKPLSQKTAGTVAA